MATLRNAATGHTGNLDEFYSTTSGCSVVTSPVGPGKHSAHHLKLSTSAATTEEAEVRSADGTLLQGDLFSFWVYIPGTNGPQANEEILQALASGGAQFPFVTVGTSGNTLTLRDAVGDVIGTSGPFSYDAWHHVLIYMQSGVGAARKMWIDGNLEVDATGTNASIYGVVASLGHSGSGTAEVSFHSIAYWWLDGTSVDSMLADWRHVSYSSGLNSLTPDVGDTLDVGVSWQAIEGRPMTSSTQVEYTASGAQSGYVITDSGTKGGPASDTDNTASTIRGGATYGFYLDRGNGSGTTHHAIYGDETTRTTSPDLQLTGTLTAYFFARSGGMPVADDMTYGFSKSAGGRDLICDGLFAAVMLGDAYDVTPTVQPTGIAPTTAFGTAKTVQRIAGTGIAAGTAFGSATVKNIQTIEATGIASTAAFGAPQANLRIAVPGTGANNVYGIPQINQWIAGTGIAPATAFGSALVKNIQVLEPTGIAPTAAFGNAQLNQEVLAAGIAPTTVFGTATTRFRLEPTGIAPTTALGEPTLNLAGASISPPGIAATTVFGTLKTVQYVTPVALPPQTNLGGPRMGHNLDVAGIAPTTAFGTPETRFGISPVGIAPAAVFGTATVIGAQTIEATGIAPQTALGAPRLDMEVLATGIPSQEAMGVPRLAQTVLAEGINPTTAFGVPRMLAVLAPTGIPSSELIGIAQLNQELQFTGIAPTTAFGEPAVLTVGGIAPPSIDPTTVFGSPTLTGGKERRGAGFVARDTTQWVTDETVDGEH